MSRPGAGLVLGIVAAVASAAWSCRPGGSARDEAPAAVLVSAAASLTDAFQVMESAFESATPGLDVVLNLGGTASLREQILGGAPVDVFASADVANMERVAEARSLRGGARTFARNRLLIAVPKGNPAGIGGLADFAKAELLLGLCAEGVPCGDLARQTLSRARVVASIDTHEPNVRALLTKIEAGELDAGIVYVTDLVGRPDRLDAVPIGDAHQIVAQYPIAVLAQAPNPGGAEAFVSYVLAAEGQRILARHGFATP